MDSAQEQKRLTRVVSVKKYFYINVLGSCDFVVAFAVVVVVVAAAAIVVFVGFF